MSEVKRAFEGKHWNVVDRLDDGSFVIYNPLSVLIMNENDPKLPGWIRENYWRLKWGLEQTSI
jgi:hypothetical protein